MPFIKAYYDFTVQRLRILGPLGGGRGSPLPLLMKVDGGQEEDAPVITEKDAVAILMQVNQRYLLKSIASLVSDHHLSNICCNCPSVN